MLKQTLNALPSAQFDDLVFALNPPKGNIPGNPAPQSNRSTALLEWAESPAGPGLSALEKLLGKTIAITSNTAEQFVTFSISGKINESTVPEVKAFVELMRKKTGNPSIDYAFIREGSIKIILSGASEGLQELQRLFNAGGLANANAVHTIDIASADARKARLVQALRFTINSTLADVQAKVLADEVFQAGSVAREIYNALRHATEEIHTTFDDLARRYDELNIKLDHTRQHREELDRQLNRTIVLNFIRRNRLTREIEDLNREIDNLRRELKELRPDYYNHRDSFKYYDGYCNRCQNLTNTLDRASDFSNTLATNDSNRHSVASDLNDTLSQASELVNDIINDFNGDFFNGDFPRYIGQSSENLIEIINRALTLVKIFVHRRNQPLNLESADLTNTNLKDVDLSQANLTEANLTGADLTGADLTGTILTGTILTGTILTGVQVIGTIFRENLGLKDTDKLALQRRGAILPEPPNSEPPRLS